MEPITREEYYLAKIAGTYEGNTPEPVTIEEYYLATMAGDYSGNTPQPVTRLQYYMAKVAGVWGGSIPAPVTRLEYYWAAIASGEGKVFPPVTREEHFLVLVADAYSVVLTVVTGNPALLENSKGNRGLESLTLYGKSTQVSTTGAQLISLNDSYGVTTVNGVTKTPIGISAWKLEGISKEDAIIYPYSSLTFLSLSKGDYVFSVFGTSKAKARYTIIGRGSSGYIQTGYSQKISIQEDVKLTFNFLIENGVESNGILMIMLNSGSTSLPWEPYTGGKPSPSPEYPQEIESAGDAGEININVQGANLFDKSTAISGWVNGEGKIIKKGAVGEFDNVVSDYIRVIPNQMYCGSFTYWWFYDNDKNFVQAVDGKRIVKTPDKARYIVVGRSCSGTKGMEIANSCMVNIGSTALPYEPYKPAQTLIIPTPNGLSGIPVSSGGNYTDADGQQWVCDEVDFKKGVYVQRVATETPKAKWKNFEETADVPNRYRISGALVNRYRDGSTKCLISHGIYTNWGIAPGWALNSTTFYYHPKEDVTKEEAKEQILGFINSANPLTFLGQLETPIEKPLTTEQLATYKALRTYSPTTTVANDAEAGMSVGYAKMK